MHYYPHHIGDYRSATAHLSNEEDLAYRRLLEMYYDTERPIPLETEWVARRLRVGCASVQAVLADFFQCTEDGWVHARCETEIATFHHRAERNRENGRKGGRKKNPVGSESVPAGMPVATQCQANQEPITNNQEPITKQKKAAGAAVMKPDSVDQSVWEDYVALRKAKKSPLTATVLDALAREATKAGWPLESAMRECCARGWQGFKAEWVADRQPTSPAAAAPKESYRERDERLARQKWEQITGRVHPENIKQQTAVIDVTPAVPFLEG